MCLLFIKKVAEGVSMPGKNKPMLLRVNAWCKRYASFFVLLRLTCYVLLAVCLAWRIIQWKGYSLVIWWCFKTARKKRRNELFVSTDNFGMKVCSFVRNMRSYSKQDRSLRWVTYDNQASKLVQMWEMAFTVGESENWKVFVMYWRINEDHIHSRSSNDAWAAPILYWIS